MIRSLAFLLITASAHAAGIDFSRQIRPILSENCFFCHGPDEAKREAGLRLDDELAAKSDNDGVIAIVPGDPEKSALIQRMVSSDPSEVMPPPKLHKKVSAAQLDLLKQWIREGAPWGGHWSYEKVVRPAVPVGASHAIDAFLLQRLKQEGLHYSEAADARTLVRRLALDLTGLPPTLEELDKFKSAPYAEVVDYYLSRPAYGEHWGQQWLDLARYADSSGYPSDEAREIWAYRDWVIQALNANMPFDQFTIEQLAGDLLPKPSNDQIIATAFHRNTMTQNEGGTDDEEFRNAAVIDRVNTTFSVWMGTTMACAQCHTHKYDPLTLKEYFQFYAFLNQSADSDKKDEAPLHRFHTAEQRQHMAKLTSEIKALDQRFAKPTSEWMAGFESWLDNTAGELKWQTPQAEKLTKSSAENSHTQSLTTSAGQLRAIRIETDPAADLADFVLSDVKAEIIVPEPMRIPDARFVRVQLPGKNPLQLAEVQVLSGGKNVAMSGVSKQSSQYARAAARLAIDGSTDGDYANGSVAHTLSEQPNQWWEVDLKSPQTIDGIKLWNRTDNDLGKRLAGVIVTVMDAKRTVLWRSNPLTEPATENVLNLAAAIPVQFTAALADHEKPGFTAASLLEADKTKRTGWAVGDANGKPHRLTLMTDIAHHLPQGALLRVSLTSQGKPSESSMQSFRVSYTGDQRADALAKLPASILSLLSESTASRTEADLHTLRQYFVRQVSAASAKERTQLAKLKSELTAIKPVTVPIMKDLTGKDQRVTKVQLRGNWLDLGEVVTPATPAVFPAPPKDAPPTRLTMARWLVSRENPLTARVTVNRLWETLFGTGIVRTSEEFGSQGELPFHPELLDWLAAEFMERGWDLKHILRLMVTTDAYRQVTRSSDALNERDPDNRLLARGPRFRSTGEQLRDQALASSGLLSAKMFGAPVRPMAPSVGLSTAFGRSNDWTPSTGEDRYRRGIYTEVRRNAPYASFTTFDAGNREFCMIRRGRTNTPLQAFVTLNDPVFVEAHQAMARRLVKEAADAPSRIHLAMRLSLSREPSPAELSTLMRLYEDALIASKADLSAATELATVPLGPAPKEADIAELAAWTTVANVIMNMDEFLMRR
jgi:hypothetical protein